MASGCARQERLVVPALVRIFERFYGPTIPAPRLERSSKRASRANWALCTAGAFAVCALVLLADPAAGQQLGNRITFDSLQLSALSVDVGSVRPRQVVPATIFGIAADYGKLSQSLRLRFEGSYWESRLTDDVTRAFTDSLRHIITDPSHDDAVVYSQVNMYDVTMGLSARWIPMQSSVFQPFIGAGVGVHVINAEGPLIDGTFVERLFDTISTGLFGEAGMLFKPLPRFGVDGRLRVDLVNGFRAVSARAGGVYYFGPLRRSL
jgi:hypothetical protein